MNTKSCSHTPLPPSPLVGPTNYFQADWRHEFRMNALNPKHQLLMATKGGVQSSASRGIPEEARHWMLNEPATAYMVEQIVLASQAAARRTSRGGDVGAELAPMDVIEALGYRLAPIPSSNTNWLVLTLRLGWQASTLLLRIACSRSFSNPGSLAGGSPQT